MNKDINFEYDIDAIQFSTQFYYYKDLKEDYPVKTEVFAPGVVAEYKIVSYDVPPNSLLFFEAYDSKRNAWFEIRSFQSIHNGPNEYYTVTPVFTGGKANLLIFRRPLNVGGPYPGITFNVRLRTVTAPFIMNKED